MINRILLWVYTHTTELSIGQQEELEESLAMLNSRELTGALLKEIIGR